MARIDRRGRALALAVTLTMVGGLVTSSAIADPAPPSEDEISAAREAEGRTSGRIAALEIELAELGAQRQELELAAQLANEEYLQAQEGLAVATQEAEAAREDAEEAATEVEAQRGELGRIAMRAYRSSPGALGPIEPLLSADNFEDAMRRATVVERLGTRADEALQRFQAVEQVSATFERRAQEAEAEQQVATEGLADAARSAQSSADTAATQVALSVDLRASLIEQLAAERGTTAALEQERQDAVEAERQRREDRRAREAALQAIRDQEAASRSVERPAPAPAADEADDAPAAATPSPAPSTPPSASPSPSPTPTSRPSPAPTTPPAPTPPAPTPPAPEPTPPPAPKPPPSSSSAARTALSWAQTQVGKPYIWGAAGPNGYDCSGLTQTAFARAGVSIPRTTRAQYQATTRVPVDQLQPGDLIFYSSNGAASGIYHVAFYAGNGMRLHAPSPGKSVELVPMYWSNVLPYGGRV